ncbi:VWA domain-containing protein [bacterium]|nr:VWA domain-containing protein [bacterium]
MKSLADCRTPFLIGVRHHSPACAVRMGEWLDSFGPDKILLELPPEFQDWLPWLAHPQLQAPAALAGTDQSDQLFFYPFADFSPELAALRWAQQRGIEVEAFDLEAACQTPPERRTLEGGQQGLLDQWQVALGNQDFESLWDERVESAAPAAQAEALRQAALLVGLVQRLQEAAEGIRLRDLMRETAMRKRLGLSLGQGKKVAVVVGSFHACALLPEPRLWEECHPQGGGRRELRTSLVPYSFELLDSRSGYPAGIRDPVWQQRIFLSQLQIPKISQSLSELAVELCHHLRQARQPAGTPDAQESVRMAWELAELRGLPAPGRAEFLQAVQSCMAQGEVLGRGRALARALEKTLVGQQRGQLAVGTPRSGLVPEVEALLVRLNLPRHSHEPVRLDPLRSPLDRSRQVFLRRLQLLGIPYASQRDSGDTLTQVWSFQWTTSSEAALELAGYRGPSLSQACRGALRGQEDLLLGLSQSAECGLGQQVDEFLARLMVEYPQSARLDQLVGGLGLLERIANGQLPGLPAQACGSPELPVSAYQLPAEVDRQVLLAAAVRALEGLAGSRQLSDVLALRELLQLEGGGLRLRWALRNMSREGSPLMQGAAAMALSLLQESGYRVPDFVAGPPGRELAERLKGALAVGVAWIEARPEWRQELLQAVADLEDEPFWRRLASLREGFEVLSQAARARFLETLALNRLDLPLAPDHLVALALADRAGLEALADLPILWVETTGEMPASPSDVPLARGQVSLNERFRLILGQPVDSQNSRVGRAARALDELYGRGHGEGSRAHLGGGAGEGSGYAGAREWGDELADLFGSPVREEVLGRAAEKGRAAALLALEPDSVVPSVELLEQALSLVGALSEHQLGQLRPLVARVLRELTRELSQRLRPALQGLLSARPTRRPGARLDLARTLRANLHTARPGGQGGWTLAPERLLFQTRQQRSLDWRIVLVVDVSGSMEASIIYSAITAAILAGLPAFCVHFLAFSTEVIDFTQRVSDPLALLMEVQVGGGTLIAPALRYARGLLTVPSRSLVLLVSDFEDGGPLAELLAEVRALVECGARPLGLAALSDDGQARFCQATAEAVVAAGMPVAALTPLELARWVGEQVRS